MVVHMKIVKRDGRTVDYDANKIRAAIEKANAGEDIKDRVSNEEIEDIIAYIESLGKKRMLVEDIQDIIEEKLMQKGKFSLAKSYIIYRYKRSLIRRSNTTDASILSIIKNSNRGEGNDIIANRQRDLMAGEASKDLAYRIFLPKNVVEAEKDNRIKFCNVEYFTEPIIESSKIDLQGMFENGTVINGVRIESPKSFQSACNILVEIIASIAACQTGNIYVELKDLFKYYYLSYEKKYATYKALMRSSLTNEHIRALAQTQTFIEVKSGIQTIYYQINTITLASGLVPKVHFLLNLKDISSEAEETIVYEFIRQKKEGIKDEDGIVKKTVYPTIIYAIPDDMKEVSRYDYITDELLESDTNYSIVGEEKYNSLITSGCKFNQGSIIINLANIALKSSGCEEFLNQLDLNLSYCYEGLSCRNHNLQGTYSDKSPIHWRNGAIARLAKKEKIDSYLKSEFSFMNLVLIGFEAAVKILDADAKFKKTVSTSIMDRVNLWNESSSFRVCISNFYDKQIVDNIFKLDVQENKKYNIETYYDSYEFMKDDYFEFGNLYLLADDVLAVDKNLLLKKGFIIKKDSSK